MRSHKVVLTVCRKPGTVILSEAKNLRRHIPCVPQGILRFAQNDIVYELFNKRLDLQPILNMFHKLVHNS